MQLEDVTSKQNFEPVYPLRNPQPFTLYSLLFVVPTGSPRPYNRPPRGISASSRRGRSDSAPSEGVVEIAVQTTVARFVCWAAESRIWSEFIRKALAGELTVGRACERGQEHFVPRWLITRLGQGEKHGRGGASLELSNYRYYRNFSVWSAGSFWRGRVLGGNVRGWVSNSKRTR